MPSNLKSAVLSVLPWAIHGFGTRNVEPVSGSKLKQIHSDLIVLAEEEGILGEGDALVTNRTDLTVSIRTADCYPILLADPRHRAVAAIHAGWRGTAAHIVQKAIQRMQIEFGTQPTDVLAAIGPGIGSCCYEVGEEVASQFGYQHRTHLDLMMENRKQLELVGVLAENIEALGVCTFCDAERFFSYRREKETAGRMTSFIRIAPAD